MYTYISAEDRWVKRVYIYSELICNENEIERCDIYDVKPVFRYYTRMQISESRANFILIVKYSHFEK